MSLLSVISPMMNSWWAMSRKQRFRKKVDLRDSGLVLEEEVDALLKSLEKKIKAGNRRECYKLEPYLSKEHPSHIQRRAKHLNTICQGGIQGFIALHRTYIVAGAALLLGGYLVFKAS